MASRGKITHSARGKTIGDKEIGLRLRAIRIDQDLSQEELGNQLGVSFQQVQKYEKGTNRISATRLMKVALALKTTPHELMGWGDGAVKFERVAGQVWFDAESYKIAKVFSELPDATKPAIRSLIMSLINGKGSK